MVQTDGEAHIQSISQRNNFHVITSLVIVLVTSEKLIKSNSTLYYFDLNFQLSAKHLCTSFFLSKTQFMSPFHTNPL